MTNAILKDELLNDNLLDLVAGGNKAEQRVDIGFLQQLGYNMARACPFDVFADNGVNYYQFSYMDNDYKLFTPDGYKNHPHWAALGYVLKVREYPGFNGNWNDESYVRSFLKEHFHITNLG